MEGLNTEDILRFLEDVPANHREAYQAAVAYAQNCGESPSSPEVMPMTYNGPSDAEVAPSSVPAKASESTRVPPSPQLSGNEMEEDSSSSSSSETDDGFETVASRSAKRKTKAPKALLPPKKANKPKQLTLAT